MIDLPDYFDEEFRDYVLAKIHPMVLHDLWQQFVNPPTPSKPPITEAEAKKLWALIKKGHIKGM